ncbi:MAG: site-specific integrase [Planctomycetales bacterium]|nr:site-specific integrase [Planctomycetales bacterium]
MSDEIRVAVASYGDGRNLMMTYRDPTTGRKVAKSSGTTDRREADRAAAVWQDELNSGRYQAPSRLTWAEFRKRYEEEKLAAMPDSTQTAYRVALDHLERTVNPDRLCKVTAPVVSRFLAKLRSSGLSDATVAKTARHLKAALRWGERQGLLHKAPSIEMPKRQKGAKLMKGRPITEEEFDRLLAAVPNIRKHDAPDWQRLLNGLWLSGLRLGEAVALDWYEGPFSVDLGGKHPRFRILGEAQKSGRDEVLPMTPDFARWLLDIIPEGEREGRVFKLTNRATGKPFTTTEVCRIVSAIGKRARVVVDKATGKYATAHDLRRAFCTRWAQKVTTPVLQRLARHSHIATTIGYYVDLDADEVAGDLWAKYGVDASPPKHGNTRGNSGREEATTAVKAGDSNSLRDNGLRE